MGGRQTGDGGHTGATHRTTVVCTKALSKKEFMNAAAEPPVFTPCLVLLYQKEGYTTPSTLGCRRLSGFVLPGCMGLTARLPRSCEKTLVGFVLTPAFNLILIPLFVLLWSPFIALGLCSSDAAVGVPPAFLAWRRLPYLIPMVLFVDLPIAVLLLATGMIEGLFLRNSLTLAVCSLFRRASQLPNREPTLPDTESGLLHARERSRPNTIDGARYRDYASVWAALEGDGDKVRPGDVRLISLNWLMALAERGDVLPRRQDLPEEAFLSSAQLRRIEQGARRGFDLAGFEEATERMTKEPSLSSWLAYVASLFGRKRNPDGLLPIISLSYCWLEAAHPDREGRQLQLLCRKLRGLYGGRGLLGACREYGFSDMVSCLPRLAHRHSLPHRHSIPGSRRACSWTGARATRGTRRCLPSGARMRRAGRPRRRPPSIACWTTRW